MKKTEKIKRITTAVMVLMMIITIISGLDLEHREKEESPVQEYLEENHEETGAVNLVESVLLDLRAYDTFGEVIILYIAIAGVIILGKEMKREMDPESSIDKGEEGRDGP
ncbi:MAG: hydrogen gas-evolving membrane-bound hydrogenase subunit E [Candidatus Natronoplasma sp.]